MDRPSYAPGFLRPFVWLLSRESSCPPPLLERFRALASQKRVALEDSHALTEQWMRLSGDADFGLKAGNLVCLGLGGALDYAINSSASLTQGVELASRYARSFGDLLDPRLEVNGTRALVRLDPKVPWPRVVADFTVAAWYTNHVRAQLYEAAELECWFAHAEPPNTDAYRRLFAHAKLRFGMPCYGFAFDVDHAERPQPQADPGLHALHCERVHVEHTALFGSRSIMTSVRDLVERELSCSRPTARDVAKRLHMSRRTLARRLEAEGTSFGAEVDDLRQRLAKQYIERPELELAEIADLLGFSHMQAFHRAFKRWTGMTPGRYRATLRH